MKPRLIHGVLGLLALLPASRFSCLAEVKTKPIPTSVCEISNNPSRFDNKMVRLRATLAGNFEISAIRDPDRGDCGSLWFTYPGSGPAAFVSMSGLAPTQTRPTVNLRRDHQFRHFQKMADAEMYPKHEGNSCEGCTRYEVTATMTGLVEFAGTAGGFGHLNGFPVQFVLHSIQSTTVKDISSSYAAADFSTRRTKFPTGFITGILRDPSGKPIPDADLNVYSATDPDAHIENDSATTDGKGRFRFAVPPGQYIIGFNTFWAPSPKFPFPPTYFPGTEQKSSARTVAVVNGQHVRRIFIHVPRSLVPRTVGVLVLWPNGTPVADANVWLSPQTDPTSIVGTSVSHTTSDGKFNLTGFQGTDYILRADKYGGLARVSCAKSVLVPAAGPLPGRISLTLEITDFNICRDIDFDVPTENKPVQ